MSEIRDKTKTAHEITLAVLQMFPKDDPCITKKLLANLTCAEKWVPVEVAEKLEGQIADFRETVEKLVLESTIASMLAIYESSPEWDRGFKAGVFHAYEKLKKDVFEKGSVGGQKREKEKAETK